MGLLGSSGGIDKGTVINRVFSHVMPNLVSLSRAVLIMTQGLQLKPGSLTSSNPPIEGEFRVLSLLWFNKNSVHKGSHKQRDISAFAGGGKD